VTHIAVEAVVEHVLNQSAYNAIGALT
jgi:hypothetical protein